MAVLIADYVSRDHIPIYAFLAGAALLAFIVTKAYRLYTTHRPYPGIPLIALPGKTAKDSFINHGTETIKLGLETTTDDQPFQLMTGTGPKIVLRNRYADEIAKHKEMSFSETVRVDLMVQYPGFEGVKVGIHGPNITRETIIRRLTQSLGLITEDLVEEVTDSIHDIFGEPTEWKSTKIQADVQHMVARLSSRVFLGKPLCRNPRWLEIAKNYTVHIFTAARELRATSSLLRPWKHWIMPNCRALRKDVKDAKALIHGEVTSRDAAARALLAQGKKPPKKADAIAWFVETARDQGTNLSVEQLVYYQLGLTLAAIHTTTEATCQALQHLCEYPQYVQPLREEIIREIGEHGWAKTTLYQLRLMDSFLKESQRHSRGPASLQRIAASDVVLSDSYTIKRGTRIVLLAGAMDERNYPDPTKFDAYRFLESKEQYASVSPEHLGFGLGLHACPGRFFVANELKIALSHLLLKYDWSYDPEKGKNNMFEFESQPMWDPSGKLRYRRRKEEIDLELVTA